jgi:hypothetical protein
VLAPEFMIFCAVAAWTCSRCWVHDWCLRVSVILALYCRALAADAGASRYFLLSTNAFSIEEASDKARYKARTVGVRSSPSLPVALAVAQTARVPRALLSAVAGSQSSSLGGCGYAASSFL